MKLELRADYSVAENVISCINYYLKLLRYSRNAITHNCGKHG